jgi:fructose-1,6-bisphosphatase/sedoheptulose 1,7-bisphosphatase-like protein
MDKIAAGPEMEGHINLDAGVAYNIEQVASVLDKPIEEVRIIALDRKRHEGLFKEIKQVGAQLHLLGDGDISAALWAARPDGEHDMLLGIGAAPEGVITATAIRGIGGVFEGRLVFRSDEEEARAKQMIDDDLTRLWGAKDLCRSDDAIFVASGVCDGYLPGVKIYENGNMHTYAELIDVQAGTLTRHDRIHKQ